LQRVQRLKEQANRNPASKPFLYDYIQALEEAHLDAELLALLPRVDLASAPPAALVRLARAANNQKRFSIAADIFRAALHRAPDRSDAIAGLSYALIDDGKAGDAVALLESHRKSMWRQVALLEAYAEALLAQREHTQALAVYERILVLDPGNRDAQRNRVFTVARLGAPHRALELAQAAPGLLTDGELLSLRSERTAIAARWGAAADPDAPDRFVATDAALAQNEQLLKEATGSANPESAKRRLQFDRIVLLRNRVRMREAADLFESLIHGAVAVPPYAKVAAADAYLNLREPEKARDLFLQAQSGGESDFGAQVGLYYAYSDAEQYEPAIAQIDKVVASTPQRINAYSPLTIADNPDYASALATAGAARGIAAIEWTIKEADPIAGGTIYHLAERMDAGAIAAQDWCFVKKGETARELWERALAPMGFRLLADVLRQAKATGALPARPQDEQFATRAPMIHAAAPASPAPAR